MNIDYRRVQSRLRDLGYAPGPVDGLRGPRTDTAVVAFKQSIGLRARPYIGPLTMAALFAAPEVKRTAVPWMGEAAKMRGLHEQRNVAQLRRWFDASVAWIDPRDIAWCGAFVATCHRLAEPGCELPDNPLGARNWQHWGQEVMPVFGATLVFWRGSRSGWKGHVGFYHGEDASHFHMLGGNQSNAVTITRVDKSRLLSARWPADIPVTGQPVRLTSAGIPISTNEA